MSDPFAVIFGIVRTKLDMSCRQVAILRLCELETGSDARQVKDISKTLDVSKPVVSRAADKLEAEGLITRAAMPGDRRTCVISITKKGKKLLADVSAENPAARKRSGRRVGTVPSGRNAAASP